MSKKAWTVVIGVALLLAVIGLGFGLNILRKEGWEGVWKRKRDFIERTQPGAGHVLDEAEKRGRGFVESR